MAEEEAEKPEEKKAEEEAEKPEEKKAEKVRKRCSSYYKIDEEGIQRLLPLCERCGPGYFMADHGDRFSCGHCGFTRYKQGGMDK